MGRMKYLLDTNVLSEPLKLPPTLKYPYAHTYGCCMVTVAPFSA
ncbi:MAG: type II toxin-antitoxin system VapC family toxin [Deltaproteobacteria bacterium]|nr:type II toxin-antitoxin system VapC family toxin [Deltaproteobacteria bacterium]